MSPEEIETIALIVREVVQASKSDLPTDLRLYTAAEASEMTGLPESWFEAKSSSGHIPSRKPGEKYRRYSRADIEAVIECCEVKPTSGPYLKAFREREKRLAQAA
jgi:hypothetical protein